MRNNQRPDDDQGDSAPAQLLLVDDSAKNLQALEAILQGLRCRLLKANSGAEALRCLLREEVALVLLDVNMPGMSGLETAALIRSHGKTRHIPIIFISADIVHAPKMVPQGYELGAVDYMLKPVDPVVLRSKVAVFVDLYDKTAELRRQKELLQGLQSYTRSLVESNIDALMTTDPQGIITDVNEQATTLTGLPREELIGTPFRNYFTDPEQAERGIRRVLSEGRVTNYELTALAKDGRRTMVSYNATTFRGHNGEYLGVFASARDVTERKLLEAERAEHALHVATLSRRLVAVQEEERRRLAGVVHDLISPNLATAKLNLNAIRSQLSESQRRDLETRFDDTFGLLDDAVAQMRDLSADLRPAVLDYAGLLPAVDGYAEQFSSRTGIAVRVTDGGSAGRLPVDVESLLFRIIQEALHNCAKHARATRVSVDLRHDGQHACLAVSDDGIGFAPELLGQPGGKPGLGLLTMRERAEFAGGRFSIDSQPGRGTCIMVEI